MEESQWWRLAVKEFILDLWDEHVLLRRNASIHNSQFAYFIPLVWRKRFDDLSMVNLTARTTVQSFVRLVVKHKFIRDCFSGSRNQSDSSLTLAFHSHIPKGWLKKEVSKLFNSQTWTDSRADYLRKTVKEARACLESSTRNARNLPFARNVIDLKVNLGCRTKLLDWFASRSVLPAKRFVQVILPKLENKQVSKLLIAQQENKYLRKQLGKYNSKTPAITRAMRLHGGNTGKWSAEALQHIFWYECMVGKWDSDLSKDHIIQGLRTIITNSDDLVLELQNASGSIFPKSTLHDNRIIFQSLQREYIEKFLKDPCIPVAMAVDDFSNPKAKSEKRSVPTYSFAVQGTGDHLIGAVIPGHLVSYKYSQIENRIRTEFLRQYGDRGGIYLKMVENGTSILCDTLSDEKLLKTCLSFNLQMETTLQSLFSAEKSRMSAILHSRNLENMGVLGLYVVETDKASDAMAFVSRLRNLRSKVDTKLVFWQSGWMHNLKCVLETASEFSFGIVDPKYFKGDARGKLRNFFQHTTELAIFYGLKFSPALKSFSDTRFEGVIETAHLLMHNPFNFLKLYSFLKGKVSKRCPRIYKTVKWNWAIHVVETIENPSTLAWVYAFSMVAKNIFGPAFSSGFRHKYTMHTSLWQVKKLFQRLQAIEQIALRSISQTNLSIRNKILDEHMNSVLHYRYAEYDHKSPRFGKCLHKWSRFTKCSAKQLTGKYYCKLHQINYSRFKNKGELHPMNNYYPPRADSLYSKFIETYAPYLLKHKISNIQRTEAEVNVFIELFRINSLCKTRLSSSFQARELTGQYFTERVQESVLLFVAAIRRSAKEFLGEYASVYNQINCLNDPRMCSQIAEHLGQALSAEHLCETKKSVVKSFRSKHFKVSDLENGLHDDWCIAKGLPVYRGLLHILSPQRENWRSKIKKLASNPELLFNRELDPEFTKLKLFLLKNKPFVTDQANEEMIKPFKKKFSPQSLVNIESLTWKVLGHLNKKITYSLIENFRPLQLKLFTRYNNPFERSKIKKDEKPTAKDSLSNTGEKNIHSNFFPLWTQTDWDGMKRKLSCGMHIDL